MKRKIYSTIAAALVTLAATAQTAPAERVLCNFEGTAPYAAVDVWDTWEGSPFRSGTLPKNIRTVDNHLTAPDAVRGFAPNPSGRILALQRSRFGSNTFGALVTLNTPFAQTKRTQYVHVKIYSPVASPAMLIGLGRRDDRPNQSTMTEQFWATGTKRLVPGRWNDVVFPVSGSNGVTIYSLLVVPDATSPHNLESDFAVYIDDIVLSGDAEPFFTAGTDAVAAKRRAAGSKVNLSRGVDDLGGGLNGDILMDDGTAVTGKTAECGKPLRVMARPAPGFKFEKLVIRHGANIDGNAPGDWTETTVNAAQFKDGRYTIPAEVVDGDMRFVPYFVNEK